MPEAFSLAGKVALVTGGAGILGQHHARTFARAGARVVIADLEQSGGEALAAELCAELGAEAAAWFPVDLANEEDTAAWAGRVLERYGALDVLLNNAATKSPNFFAPIESFPLSDWEAVLRVNVTAMFLTVRHFGPGMLARGSGSIINVSSIYGMVGPDQRIYEGSYYEAMGGEINTPLVYSVSKGAVLALTRHLATTWGPQGVRTNTLTPGGVSSGQNSTFAEKYSARVPLGRMGKADELAGALLFLASDASSYVNGQNLVVDGGLTAW